MSLEADFQHYKSNEQSLVKLYDGKFIVISKQEVIATYDERKTAYFESRQNLGMGNFIIQLCSSSSEQHAHVFHSRIIEG